MKRTATVRPRASRATAAGKPAATSRRASTARQGKLAARATAKKSAPEKVVRKARTTRAKSRPARPVSRAGRQLTSNLKWTEVLDDGTHVIVRPITARDAALEREFIERLSPQSRRMRFLGQIARPGDDMIRRLTTLDYVRDMAFVALVHRDGKTQEIGVSRYSVSDDGRSCECAVTVSDEWRHRGLATLLMRHLIGFARTKGIRSMISWDAFDNTEMRALAAWLGFERRPDLRDAGMVIHRLAL